LVTYGCLASDFGADSSPAERNPAFIRTAVNGIAVYVKDDPKKRDFSAIIGDDLDSADPAGGWD
jgi:hypothetical protein